MFTSEMATAYTEGVENTPWAPRLARIALASCAPGHAEVRLFDNAPVPMLVARSPTA